MNVAMAIIASCIGIFFHHGSCSYLFPRSGQKDIILLLSIFMVVGLYLLFRFLRPERLVNPEAFFSVAQYVSALKVPDSPFLPTHWITETLWANLNMSEGRPAESGIEILLTWATAASAGVINVWIAHFIYF